LSKTHDSPLPAPGSPERHADGPAYRIAAIRETFEESGILLATSKKTGRLFTEVNDAEREQGRRDVHSGKVKFLDLLHQWGAEPDVEGLIPFTRWITPENVPKRFSTQMYIYFLPLPSSSSPPSSVPGVKGKAEEDEIVIPTPTHDGGIEHTAARFLPANKWLALARQNRIILFPPQFFLTYLLSPFLAPTVTGPDSPIPDVETLRREREGLIVFLNQEREYKGEKEVSFAEACISPVVLGRGEYGEKGQDGVGGVSRDTAVLVLDMPGNEVKGQGRRGLKEWVVTTKFIKSGPSDVDIRKREDILGNAVGKL
jgi:8-oxo-dGTP pyrophosphatase MutT (NUDIX family)